MTFTSKELTDKYPELAIYHLFSHIRDDDQFSGFKVLAYGINHKTQYWFVEITNINNIPSYMIVKNCNRYVAPSKLGYISKNYFDTRKRFTALINR
jgi:hypothetical protein